MPTTEMIEKVKNLRDDFRTLSLTAYHQHKDAFADAHDMTSELVDELEAMAQDTTPERQ